jgi:acyl-[acyl-carrier-protein]-phospholipid O-acyltransferase/long-chain-fatty-acid--[acyl-carrier-protein] ligase
MASPTTGSGPVAETRRPLRGLLIAQFFGAFNDNAWKMVVALVAMGGPGGSQADAQTQTTIAFVALTLPLMLFSLPAGALADRVSKRTVIVVMKAAEVILMALVAIALLAAQDNIAVLRLLLVLMGVQSAFFSPAKYGILPEILPHGQLSRGNGLLEMWSFLAIICGTAAAGPALVLSGERIWIVGTGLMVLSFFGLVASITVPRVQPARSHGGVAETVGAAWKAVRAKRTLSLTIVGLVIYWAIASLLGQNMLVYGNSILSLPRQYVGVPLAVFGVGVGIGSVVAGRLSGPNVETGLIPLGGLGFAVGTLALGFSEPGVAGTLALSGLTGVASGFLIVPLNALLQWLSPPDVRGAVIAVSNVFVFGGILLGSLAAGFLSKLELHTGQIFALAGAASAIGTLWAMRLLPIAFLRLVLFLLTHTFYRLRVIGREHLPRSGGALLVPNHISFVDGLFLTATTDRPIRFIVEANYFHHPFLRPFMKAVRAIPISGTGGPRQILRSLREAGECLDDGELVCIFAEGQITRTGFVQPFRRGLERIIRGRTAPIIPVNLDRVWGSIFSREGGRFLTKLPRRIPYPITVAFGAPMEPGGSLHQVRQAVLDLGEAAWSARKQDRPPLHRTFIRIARRHPFEFALGDARRPRMRRIQALAGSIALARALRRHWKSQECVGVLLPPSVAGVLANLAASIAGKTSANLNYTVGRAGLESAANQAGLQTVLASRQFVDKAKLDLPGGVEILMIEDIARTIRTGSRLAALLIAVAAPVRVMEMLCGAEGRIDVDDAATVIFSSGSTGEPKGVLLTHFNIDSNVEGVIQVLRTQRGDAILGILPLFHSFGYMALWFVMNQRMGIVLSPNPLDAAVVGELIERYGVTILLATPTFLQIYHRRCTPAQFGSLRMVIAGAEKLTDNVAQSFEDRFGIRPLEGYGASECSPVIAVNALDYRAPGFYQPGSRRGSVGWPLPGVSIRIVDPDTGEPQEANQSGMILVRGPNVMKGYLNRSDLTAAVMRDGWYVTGDIGRLDDDGFLWITDRLSRFSKIGGEMVPHGRVEEELHEVLGSESQVFAVTGLPDERKGERLAVLHTLETDQLAPIVDSLQKRGLPNLFIPRLDQFVKVDEIPLLGTGKMDLRRIREIAEAALA